MLLNNNNRNNLYSHGNTTTGLHDSNLPNGQNNGRIKDINDTNTVSGSMESKHSTSAIHGLLPKHQQDSGISLTSSDLNQQDNNMDQKEYLQENYDEWFLPDQYADYKAEKMKSLTKSLIEMTTKDTESVKSSNSFVIDASDTTPEEVDYLQSVQKELGSQETVKKKEAKKEAKKEDVPSKNLEDVEDRVARLMEYLNRHVPDEDTESIADQDVDKSTNSLVNSKPIETLSQNVEMKLSRSSQEILKHSDVKSHSKQSLLLQTNDTKLASSSKVQKQSIVKSDIKVLSKVSKDSTKRSSEGLNSIQKSPAVSRRRVRSQSPNIRQTRSVQLRQTKTENTEQKKQSVKKKVNERNYFKPIHAPAIPPVRHAKSHLPKTVNTSNTAKSPPTKPKRYSPKLSRRYKRPVVREPPTTIRYPSRSERERQLKEAEEIMSSRSTSQSNYTDNQTTISDDVFSQGGEQNGGIIDDQTINKSESNTLLNPSTSEDTNQKDIPSASAVPSTTVVPSASVVSSASVVPSASMVPSTSVVPSTSKGPNHSDNPIPTHSHTSKCNQPVSPSVSIKRKTMTDPGTSKDSSQSGAEASPEELQKMETLLKISEKCFVRKSKSNVSRSS